MEATSLQLQRMMVDVVRRGTDKALANFINKEYKVGVKTGTAERIQKDGNKTNVAWMIGFAGRKDPEIAFAVVVEDTTGYAGEVCSPIIKSVLAGYFANGR